MHWRAYKQHIFRSYNTSAFNATRCDESFHTPVRKKDKNAKGFQISQFYWLFSSDIKAVRGLSTMKSCKATFVLAA